MIYINGKFASDAELVISAYDRGFLLGDGIFETMRAVNGEVEFLKAHWKRLCDAALLLNMPISIELLEVKQILSELLKKNSLDKGVVGLRVTLTRGIGPRGLLPAKKNKPTLLMTSSKMGEQHKNNTLIVSSIARNEYSPLANIKSINYLDNILARLEAEKQGACDAIMLNTKKNVAETTTANIFVIKNNMVYTPKISDGALPGIIRQVIFKTLQQNEIPIEEKTFDLDFLLSADEIFLTNSLIHIKSIKQINAHGKVKQFKSRDCKQIIHLFNCFSINTK